MGTTGDPFHIAWRKASKGKLSPERSRRITGMDVMLSPCCAKRAIWVTIEEMNTGLGVIMGSIEERDIGLGGGFVIWGTDIT